MAGREKTLDAFEILIGSWETEATHPMLEGAVSGTATFEWLPGRRFLVLRTHNDHEQVPDAISVIGPPEDGEGLVMDYFDSRGVRRTYGVSLADGVWRMWRNAEGFDQRFEAVPADKAFDGRWQLARTPDDWQDDLRVTYRRAATSPSS